MKKFIIIGLLSTVLMFTFSNINIKAQTQIKREGKTFVQSSSRESSNDVETTYTWKDSKGVEYPIILHQYTKGDNAGEWTCYVIKTSAKTGKSYKYYLKDGKEIANTIRKEMGLK